MLSHLESGHEVCGKGRSALQRSEHGANERGHRVRVVPGRDGEPNPLLEVLGVPQEAVEGGRQALDHERAAPEAMQKHPVVAQIQKGRNFQKSPCQRRTTGRIATFRERLGLKSGDGPGHRFRQGQGVEVSRIRLH